MYPLLISLMKACLGGDCIHCQQGLLPFRDFMSIWISASTCADIEEELSQKKRAAQHRPRQVYYSPHIAIWPKPHHPITFATPCTALILMRSHAPTNKTTTSIEFIRHHAYSIGEHIGIYTSSFS